MLFAINRYSNSRRPATANPKAANYHANIEAPTASEAVKLSGLSTRGFYAADADGNCLLLVTHAAHGPSIWVRPAVPGSRG